MYTLLCNYEAEPGRCGWGPTGNYVQEEILQVFWDFPVIRLRKIQVKDEERKWHADLKKRKLWQQIRKRYITLIQIWPITRLQNSSKRIYVYSNKYGPVMWCPCGFNSCTSIH